MSSRVRNHILEEHSIAFLRSVFPDHWVIHQFVTDYGIDVQIEVFAENGDRTGIRFYGQVKATDKSEDKDVLQLDREHFEYWAAQTDPVVLLRYFHSSKKLCWCWMHDVFWRMKSDAQSIDVSGFVMPWVQGTSCVQVEEFLHERKAVMFEPVMPPFSISVETAAGIEKSAAMAARIAGLIGSNSFRIIPKELGEGTFHVVLEDGKIAVSHRGLPGFVFHHNEKLSEPEIFDQALLAIFLCSYRYGRVIFARALVASSAPRLYHAAGDGLIHIFYDAMIFTLGLIHAEEVIEPFLAEEGDANVKWMIFMTVCASASFRYGEDHSWRTLLKKWLERPPIPGNSGAFLYNIGNSYTHIGQWQSACDAYASALMQDSGYEERSYFWVEYGAANFETKNFQAAITCYQKALQLKDESARWRLGDCFFHSGWYDRAINEFKTALLSPELNNRSYVELLLRASEEICDRWGIISQAPSSMGDEEYSAFQTLSGFKSETDVIDYLRPKLHRNAIDGCFNFNAGVFASNHGCYEIAAFRFLTCALRQREDEEAWINAVKCALRFDVYLALACIEAAHFYLRESFLVAMLGLIPGKGILKDEDFEVWQTGMLEVAAELERVKVGKAKGISLRIHGEGQSVVHHFGG